VIGLIGSVVPVQQIVFQGDAPWAISIGWSEWNADRVWTQFVLGDAGGLAASESGFNSAQRIDIISADREFFEFRDLANPGLKSS